jgi:hypothetical protein
VSSGSTSDDSTTEKDDLLASPLAAISNLFDSTHKEELVDKRGGVMKKMRPEES